MIKMEYALLTKRTYDEHEFLDDVLDLSDLLHHLITMGVKIEVYNNTLIAELGGTVITKELGDEYGD